jgi:hypothetical protein
VDAVERALLRRVEGVEAPVRVLLAAAAEEVAASTEQTAATVQQVSATAEQLQSGAVRVHDMVREFLT